jgi:predicted RNase H-like nuclease (RuvC/YqgF family)
MALIGVLIVGLAIVSFLLFRSHSANQEMQQLFEVEKEEMENEYSNFANQYDELQIKINNDSLYQKLEQEKLKTQRLLEELRQVKSSNAAEIMRLRKELKTVRAVMRTYIIQIDSLNRINQQLTSENQSVKKKYNEATQQISSLSEEKKTLNEKVTLASQLDATHITVTPTNKRGKKTDRIKRITRLDISFTVVKNITAETGQRTLYVRITKPNQEVLTKSAANTFPYENRNIAYSIKKYIEYTGEEQNVTVYWNVEEFLQAGTYRVDIFADGNLIGSQTFDLD